MPLNCHPPGFVGLRQFCLNILSFEKQTYRIWCPESLCISEQLLQRLAGSRGHDIERLAPRILDPGAPDFEIKLESSRDRFQKTAFLLGGFKEHDFEIGALAEHLAQDQ